MRNAVERMQTVEREIGRLERRVNVSRGDAGERKRARNCACVALN